MSDPSHYALCVAVSNAESPGLTGDGASSGSSPSPIVPVKLRKLLDAERRDPNEGTQDESLSTIHPSDSISQVSLGSQSSILSGDRRQLLIEQKRLLEQKQTDSDLQIKFLQEKQENADRLLGVINEPVSYTHLTLPTKA